MTDPYPTASHPKRSRIRSMARSAVHRAIPLLVPGRRFSSSSPSGSSSCSFQCCSRCDREIASSDTHNTPGPLAAKNATSVIPIVFATAGDPVGTGIVASLARPGGNITGLSAQTPDAVERRLELLREVVPGLRRLAVLSDVDNPLTVLETSEVQKAARRLAIEVAAFGIRRDEDIAGAFEAFRDRAEALYVTANPISFTNRIRINTFALAARLPTMYVVREYVEAGGLM